MKKILILFLCSILLTGCGNKKLSNEEMGKVDQDSLSSKFFEDQTLGNITIKDFNIVVEDGMSTVYFNIKNNTADNIELNNIKVYMYDENDLLLQELNGYVGDILEGSATKSITVDVDIDLSNVIRVSFERV